VRSAQYDDVNALASESRMAREMVESPPFAASPFASYASRATCASSNDIVFELTPPVATGAAGPPPAAAAAAAAAVRSCPVEPNSKVSGRVASEQRQRRAEFEDDNDGEGDDGGDAVGDTVKGVNVGFGYESAVSSSSATGTTTAYSPLDLREGQANGALCTRR
jgi:hypothetical protein